RGHPEVHGAEPGRHGRPARCPARPGVGRQRSGGDGAMRFHLVDRILECEPGQSVRARKVCSLYEEFWEGEGDDLRMPPPLVLEAFCQAGTWLVMITTDRRKRAALLSIGSV